jgi:hypothetical protein
MKSLHPDGPNEGLLLITREEIDVLLDEYYLARGWDENGIPTKETLEEVSAWAILLILLKPYRNLCLKSG